jgi:hypothetical protein
LPPGFACDGQAQWGISTVNVIESTNFVGTWQLTATRPGGGWTATRTGTWNLNDGNHTNSCAVNP